MTTVLRGTLAAFLALGATGASATELLWRPLSPSFGGDPLNATHLYQSAQVQNQHRPKPPPQPSLQEQFVRDLQSRIYSRLASQLTEQIFGANGREAGSFEIGDQNVSYRRDGQNIVLNLQQGGGGSTTITLPVSSLAP